MLKIGKLVERLAFFNGDISFRRWYAKKTKAVVIWCESS